jgi:hypothetical protein
MIEVSKEQMSNVAQLFKMYNTSGGNLAILQSLTKEFLPNQYAVICWDCPSSLQTIYKRLLKHFEGGYKLKEEKVELDSLEKAKKEVEDYENNNKQVSFGNSKGNSKQKSKGTNTNTTSNNR